MARLKWYYFPLLILQYLMLGVLKVPSPWVITLTILLCFFFPKQKRTFVIAGSMVLGLFLSGNFYALNSYLTISSPFQLSDQFHKFQDVIPLPAVNLASYIVYLLLLALIWAAYRFLFKRFSLVSTFFILSAIYGFVYLSSTLDFSNPTHFLFAIGTAVLVKHTWYVFLFCRDFSLGHKDKAVHWMTNVLPVWTNTTEGRENLNLQKYDVGEIPAFDQTFQGGIRRLMWIMFWYFILVYLKIGTSTLLTSEFVGTDFGYRYNEIVFNIYRTWPSQEPWKIIISVLTFGLSHIIGIFLVHGQMIVAIAHLCGYRLTDYSDEPWKATSFANFFGRLMYYYNYIILTYFYFPALQLTKRWNLSREARIVLCLPFSIFVGGFLYHFMRDSYRPFQYGVAETVDFYIRNLMPYMLYLSVTLTFSAIRSKNKTIRPSLSIQQTARIASYIGIYSIGMMLNCAYFFGGIHKLPSVFLHLLGKGQ